MARRRTGCCSAARPGPEMPRRCAGPMLGHRVRPCRHRKCAADTRRPRARAVGGEIVHGQRAGEGQSSQVGTVQHAVDGPVDLKGLPQRGVGGRRPIPDTVTGVFAPGQCMRVEQQQRPVAAKGVPRQGKCSLGAVDTPPHLVGPDDTGLVSLDAKRSQAASSRSRQALASRRKSSTVSR